LTGTTTTTTTTTTGGHRDGEHRRGRMEATEEDPAGTGRAASGHEYPRIRELVGAFQRLLPVDGAAVGIRAGADTAQLVHATDPVIAELDDLQFTLGEGPCVDAHRNGTPVLVADLTGGEAFARWPGFAHEATQAGAAAAFAFPLQIGAAPFGTVELYRRVAGPLTAADTATALLIADDMVTVVLDELAGRDQLQPTTGRPVPMFGRVEIPQATGMIAVQLGITVPQALAQLRAAAFAQHRPVLDLAVEVINRRTTFPPDTE
jgi:hypothetical protein